MKIFDFGLLDYEKSLKIMDDFIKKVKKDRVNRLIFCSHYPVFTIGSENIDVGFDVVKTDRGGSITYHDEGCLMIYFIFLIKSPPLFYKKVIKVFKTLFENFDKRVYYDFKRPGFYIENRKIASLGFRYKDGVSKHGVSLHIDPNLENFNKINPCNLKDIKATSFKNEGITLSKDEAKKILVKFIENEFE